MPDKAIIAIIVSLVAAITPQVQSYTCDVPDEWIQDSAKNFYPGNLWPNGVVKYEFNNSLSSDDIDQVRLAFYEIQNKTCIRFQQRDPNEVAYVSIENDPTTCGVAHLCRTGRYQYAKFGGTCRRAQVMVHELGHTLCYGHEQARKDRDDYINFPGCTDSEIPGKNEYYDLMGSMYDYASQMHYSCGRCSGGWPTMQGAAGCGDHVSGATLSVLDVNKINALYDCTGCLSYRFKNFMQMLPVDEQLLLTGGYNPAQGATYICRSYYMADIIPGVYFKNSKTCTVGYNGRSYVIQAGDALLDPSNAGFRWETSSGTIPSNAVAGGRTATGQTLYIGRGNTTVGGIPYQLTGKIHPWSSNLLHAPLNGVEYSIVNFEILVCI